MKLPLLLSLMAAGILLQTGSTVVRAADQSAGATDNVQLIKVTAKKYEFDPSPIRVKQGARVRLEITATDHAHGFSIKLSPDGASPDAKPGLVFSSSQECLKIEKGQTETLEFVAQTPGTYSFRCCVHCGWDHRGMKGQLIVEP